jgi:hypothetical protein
VRDLNAVVAVVVVVDDDVVVVIVVVVVVIVWSESRHRLAKQRKARGARSDEEKLPLGKRRKAQ